MTGMYPQTPRGPAAPAALRPSLVTPSTAPPVHQPGAGDPNDLSRRLLDQMQLSLRPGQGPGSLRDPGGVGDLAGAAVRALTSPGQSLVAHVTERASEAVSEAIASYEPHNLGVAYLQGISQGLVTTLIHLAGGAIGSLTGSSIFGMLEQAKGTYEQIQARVAAGDGVLQAVILVLDPATPFVEQFVAGVRNANAIAGEALEAYGAGDWPRAVELAREAGRNAAGGGVSAASTFAMATAVGEVAQAGIAGLKGGTGGRRVPEQAPPLEGEPVPAEGETAPPMHGETEPINVEPAAQPAGAELAEPVAPAPAGPAAPDLARWNSPTLSEEEALALYRRNLKGKGLSDSAFRAKFRDGLRYDPGIRRWRRPSSRTPAPAGVDQMAGLVQEDVFRAKTGWAKNTTAHRTDFGGRRPDFMPAKDPATGRWTNAATPAEAEFVADSKYYSDSTVRLTDQMKGFIELASKSKSKRLLLMVNADARISSAIQKWATPRGVTIVRIAQRVSR